MIKNKDLQYYDTFFKEYPYQKISTFVDQSKTGLSRYEKLLPVKGIGAFSLGEGSTPLTKATALGKDLGFTRLYIKHEELNPTGSFKDRESVVAVTLAAKNKLREVTIVSSGNAALSMAAYTRKAGIACTCFVPTTTSEEKKKLISFFGAKLYQIDGNYEQVYRHVADNYDRVSNLTSGICSDRVEATKTIAYEIWETMPTIPELVLVPCGNGGNLAGIGRGFYELQQMGKIKKMPRLVAVQVAGASPIAAAMKKDTPFEVFPNKVDSIAEGILAEESYCSPKAIDVLKKSNGFVIEVEESEIVRAMKQVLQKESLILEPTAAAAFAALPKLKAFNVARTASVVVIATGSGMKMLGEVQHLTS